MTLGLKLDNTCAHDPQLQRKMNKTVVIHLPVVTNAGLLPDSSSFLYNIIDQLERELF